MKTTLTMNKFKETLLSELKRQLEMDGEDELTNEQILYNIGNLCDTEMKKLFEKV